MILVLLGTHELPFTRLLKEVERLKVNGTIDEEIIVQNGHTKYESDVLTLKPFVSFEEMDQLYNQARFVITHAGTGSVITGLKKGKKVIAAARLEKYGEHNDDHQIELVSVFVEQGHILSWEDGEDLGNVIQQLETFEPIPFHSEKEKLLGLLRDFIEKA
ncbi:PssE/Cps14G family polysaccharide biosynthesis glycosyltransferase [Oceanobacillus senegalensis]|uniref:PssE/Cps14G family polysaccharide biosynthesis glycosyltransferase n=1 Tax=Oceanobacillus senegalensis TaxID=1936063 RepID=UPI000A30710B|nr:PssE/Cps14G family polysaccharide biosynthesis glycosyltransferase [Oceanobacillus senegalensis]